MACAQDADVVTQILYPHYIHPCSVEQVMANHCSFSLLALSLLVCDFSWVECQLCISACRLAFG